MWTEHFSLDFIWPSLLPLLSKLFVTSVCFLITVRLLKKITTHIFKKCPAELKPFVDLATQATKVVLWLLFLISLLGSFGIHVNALIASLGLSGFALSFALQDALANVLAGMMVLFYKPFRVGQRIIIDSSEGEVVSIDLRYTKLKDKEIIFLVPNATILKKTVRVLP